MSLTSKKWKPFYLLDLFSFEKGNQNQMNLLDNGDYPLISARNIENGLKRFVKKNSKKMFNGHCITLNLDGDGGAGIAYYQPYRMYLDSHVGVLSPKQKMSKYVLLFISACLTKQRKIYGHGHSINLSRIKTYQFFLPINNDLKPDYTFMHKYMKEKENKMLIKYKEQCNIAKESVINLDDPLCHYWNNLQIDNIITNIQRGKRLKTGDHIPGKIPYVSSSAIDNGVDSFIGNEANVRKFKNCLTLANSGSVGATFYHPYEFIASDHVTKLENLKFNKYVYLYLSVITSRLSEKYSFNHEINEPRLKREQLFVPVDANGVPDYAYMESYMRAVETKLMRRYIDSRFAELSKENE